HRTFFAYTADGQRVDTDPAAHFARIGRPLPDDLRSYMHSTPQQDDPDDFEPLAIRPSDWPEALQDITAAHLAPLPLATHLHVPAQIRGQGIKLITVDPGERYMVPERLSYIAGLLPQIDVFLPSDMEVRSLYGNDINLWQAAKSLNSLGAPVVVIKIGSRGVLIYDGAGNNRYHLLPFHGHNDNRVIDVTGAGDAFCGGFLVGLAQTADLLFAANMGLVSASLVIEGYGALFALEANRSTAVKRLRELNERQIAARSIDLAEPF
ncbi:MAG: carbohydrate kinase family protein, partial [Candidatus Promineifilaceae bacterium]|nr:carbohydrate kinase family protein [Candidatus Promineifilaceae bacterium]